LHNSVTYAYVKIKQNYWTILCSIYF